MESATRSCLRAAMFCRVQPRRDPRTAGLHTIPSHASLLCLPQVTLPHSNSEQDHILSYLKGAVYSFYGSRLTAESSSTRTCRMASPNVSRANNENARNTASTPRKANGTRQALGDKSPNVVAKGAIAGSAGKRAMTGSPLKRGFPAAIEDGKGFTFLKRRRISDNQVPSGPYESMERSTTQQGDGNICGFRPLFLTGPTVRTTDAKAMVL